MPDIKTAEDLVLLPYYTPNFVVVDSLPDDLAKILKVGQREWEVVCVIRYGLNDIIIIDGSDRDRATGVAKELRDFYEPFMRSVDNN